MTHRNHTLAIIALGLAVDLFALLAWSVPALSPAVAGVLTVVVLLVAIWQPRLGIAALLLELLWGGHGYLFEVPLGGIRLSLRMGLFLAALAACVVRCIDREARTVLMERVRSHPARWTAAAFACTLLLALVIGLARNSFDDVFFDANGWAYLALVPMFLLGIRGQDDVRWIAGAVLAGGAYLILRTYVLLFAFSHDLGGLWLALYQWVRDTRLGEVTVFPGGFPRLFFPSMAFLFPVWFLAARRSSLIAYVVFGGGVAVILASLSRSFWLAGVVLTVGFLGTRTLHVVRVWPRARRDDTPRRACTLRSAVVLVGAVVAAFALIVITVRLPWPAPLARGGLGALVSERLSADAAVANRWRELSPLRAAIATHPLFGSGFGASVTYRSSDPRTLAEHSDGFYTTTAFEWGYLDHLLESGAIGLMLFIVLLAHCCVIGWRQGGDARALAVGLFAFIVVHATTPFLNHPIGLGLILLLVAVIAVPRDASLPAV